MSDLINLAFSDEELDRIVKFVKQQNPKLTEAQATELRNALQVAMRSFEKEIEKILFMILGSYIYDPEEIKNLEPPAIRGFREPSDN